MQSTITRVCDQADRAEGLSEEEITRLFIENSTPMRANALRLTKGNLPDAEDLVQETCMRAFRFRHRFAMGTSFRNWVNRIMLNLFINGYRKGKTRANHGLLPYSTAEESAAKVADSSGVRELSFTRVADEVTFLSIASPTAEECREIAARYLTDELLAAFDNIRTVGHKVIILLCDVYGYEYKEIAAMLNVPKGTVMSGLKRARDVFRADPEVVRLARRRIGLECKKAIN